jgi:hypothetical protein
MIGVLLLWERCRLILWISGTAGIGQKRHREINHRDPLIDKVSLMIKICLCFLVIFIHFQIFTMPIYALTAEEIIRLKEAGVDDKTIQMLIKKEKKNGECTNGLGTKEIERPDAGKDKVYYSITTPEEERKNQEEEKEKLEKSLELLKNIIIDKRGR